MNVVDVLHSEDIKSSIEVLYADQVKDYRALNMRFLVMSHPMNHYWVITPYLEMCRNTFVIFKHLQKGDPFPSPPSKMMKQAKGKISLPHWDSNHSSFKHQT